MKCFFLIVLKRMVQRVAFCGGLGALCGSLHVALVCLREPWARSKVNRIPRLVLSVLSCLCPLGLACWTATLGWIEREGGDGRDGKRGTLRRRGGKECRNECCKSKALERLKASKRKTKIPTRTIICCKVSIFKFPSLKF